MSTLGALRKIKDNIDSNYKGKIEEYNSERKENNYNLQPVELIKKQQKILHKNNSNNISDFQDTSSNSSKDDAAVADLQEQ